MITIYQAGTTAVRAVIDPDSSSQQEQEIMGKDIVMLSFSYKLAINFQIGDYCNVFDNKYILNTAPQLQKIADRNYVYKLTMEGKVQDLGRVNFLFLDAHNNFTDADFSMRGTIIDFGNILVANIKRIFPNDGWVFGGAFLSDYQTLTFSNVNCLSAMNTIVAAFNTEWYLDGTKLYLQKRQPVSPIVLQYGAGLFGMTRDNQDNGNVITRLYAYGSDKNIGSNYRNGSKRLRMAKSLYIEKNVAKYGIFEGSQTFDTIYPQRTGVLSAITSLLVFTDSSINFDINAYLIPGTTAKITFNTGMLAGYTFEIANFNYSTKTFTINQNTQEQTIVLPNTGFAPAIGDTYVLVDIMMPTSYVDAAEAALLTAAQSFISDNCEPKYKYTIVCDSNYLKRNKISFKLGMVVSLYDLNLAINVSIRIFGFTRNIRNPYGYTLILSDYLSVPIITKIINFIKQ
jgi:hypothetical protein